MSDEAPPRAVNAEDDATGEAAQREARSDTDTSSNPSLFAQFEALYFAGTGLTAALRRFALAFSALFGAEARVLWAGIPLFFIGTIALVAFSVSLWACVVALLFWALRVATHSAGIALGILVAGHALLVVGLWLAIKRGVQQASFPQARAELRAMGRQMKDDLDRFAHAHPSPARGEEKREVAP